MSLYFNGCSHTYGDDLEHPEKDAWPALVASHYKMPFLNDAISGGTNDRIVQRTLKHINDFDKFYIAWTSIARFSRPSSDTYGLVNFNPQLHHNFYGDHERFKVYGHLHYKYWYDELYSFKTWLHQIILLQHVFEKNNKDYRMLITNRDEYLMLKDLHQKQNLLSYLMYNLSDEQLSDEYNEIKCLLNLIDLSRFLDWNNWFLRIYKKEVKLGKTLHYLEEGHKRVAEHIIKNA